MDQQELVSKKRIFGKLVRKHRLAKGYTQQKLSVLIGIQPKSVSFIERGLNYPSPENIFKLAEVLDISLDEYVFSYCKFNQTISNQEINNMIEHLSEKEKRFLIAILKTVFDTLISERSNT